MDGTVTAMGYEEREVLYQFAFRMDFRGYLRFNQVLRRVSTMHQYHAGCAMVALFVLYLLGFWNPVMAGLMLCGYVLGYGLGFLVDFLFQVWSWRDHPEYGGASQLCRFHEDGFEHYCHECRYVSYGDVEWIVVTGHGVYVLWEDTKGLVLPVSGGDGNANRIRQFLVKKCWRAEYRSNVWW